MVKIQGDIPGNRQKAFLSDVHIPPLHSAVPELYLIEMNRYRVLGRLEQVINIQPAVASPNKADFSTVCTYILQDSLLFQQGQQRQFHGYPLCLEEIAVAVRLFYCDTGKVKGRSEVPGKCAAGEVYLTVERLLQGGENFITVGVDIQEARQKHSNADDKSPCYQRQNSGKLDVSSYLHRGCQCLGICELC